MDTAAFDADMDRLINKSPEKTETPKQEVVQEEPKGTSEAPELSKQPAPEPSPQVEFDPESLPEPAKRAWKAKLDEQTKLAQHLKSLEDDNKSLRGRLPTLQRELAALKAAKPDPAKPAGAPETPAERKRSEKWEKFARDYPDEAAAHEEALRERDQEIEGLKSQLAKLGDTLKEVPQKLQLVDEIAWRMEEQRAREERQTILSEHSDFYDHLKLAIEVDDDGREVPVIAHISEPMQKWRETVPSSVFNMLASDKPREVAYAYGLFKQTIAAAEQQEQTQKGARVEEARKKTVASAVAPPIHTPGVTRVNPADLDQNDAFDLDMDRLLAKKRRA